MKPVARQFACMVRLCWKMCVMMRTICSAAEALFWLRFFLNYLIIPFVPISRGVQRRIYYRNGISHG